MPKEPDIHDALSMLRDVLEQGGGNEPTANELHAARELAQLAFHAEFLLRRRLPPATIRQWKTEDGSDLPLYLCLCLTCLSIGLCGGVALGWLVWGT